MKTVIGIVAIALLNVSGLSFGKQSVSLEELRKHNKETDCWMVIDGAVYDMSSYIKLHSEECKKMKFSELCGTDASDVWKSKESGEHPHKQKSQRSLLKSKIGTFGG